MPCLLLHASDSCWRPDDLNGFVQALRETGLIGRRKAPDNPSEFWVGDQFSKLVMFLGCSPQPVLDPKDASDGQATCFVRLSTFAGVTFMSAKTRPAARCPGCRTEAELSQPEAFDASYRCKTCGKASQHRDLDWRQAAGFACLFIEIDGIHPQEAVPSDKLLGTLKGISSSEWKHFFT